MKKKSIAYYTANKLPLSLRELVPVDGMLEDIFYAVNDATCVSDLTKRLNRAISRTAVLDEVTEKFVRYRILYTFSSTKYDYLKIVFKEPIDMCNLV